MNRNRKHHGLILLVVLAMLALFSMLAVTYVVFSSQSRNSSFGIARRDFHRMPPETVLDEALGQVLRGTANTRSAVGPHSLLADVYGHNESIIDRAVFTGRNSVGGTDRAEVFASRFLRIPLAPGRPAPPDVSDVLTGRVLTFLDGPLRNVSFRIVRSIGDLTGSSVADVRDQSYSVIIDLDEALNSSSSVGAASRTIAEWIARAVANRDDAVALCAGYRMLVNARELNSFGYGIPLNMDNETVAKSATRAVLPGARAAPPQPVGLQPGLQSELASNMSTAGALLTGDSDESYDAADYNDFWLAHRKHEVSSSADIIPSFHRAALVNYIVNAEKLDDATSFTEEEFLDMLDDIQRACARPLAISVVNLEGPRKAYFSANRFFDGGNRGNFPTQIPSLSIDLRGAWTNWTSGTPPNRPVDQFTAWARGLTLGPWDVDSDRDGIEDAVWIDPDLPLITSSEGKLLKMLVAYYIEDLDNRIDINATGNLLQSAYEGRPVSGGQITNAYNANTGVNNSYAVGHGVDFPQGFGYGPAEISFRHFFGSDQEYRRFLYARYGGNFGHPGGGAAYRGGVANVLDDLTSQLNGGGSSFVGTVLGTTHNAILNTGTSGQRQLFRHDQLPAIPNSVRGNVAVAFDRLGNPLMLRATNNWFSGANYLLGDSVTHVSGIYACVQNHSASAATEPFNGSNWTTAWVKLENNEGTDDPYESRLATSGRQDQPFGIADWERVYRRYDIDRSMLPSRLESFFGSLSPEEKMRITPKSAHTRFVPLTATAATDPSTGLPNRIESLFELIHALGQFRSTPITINAQSFAELFPIEFNRGLAMDLNRPLGNGRDDDLDGQIDEPEEMLKNGLDDDSDGMVDERDELALFSGTALNLAQRQKSLYAANGRIQTTAVSEFPTFSVALGDRGGYTGGNLDPEYEAVVQDAMDASSSTAGQSRAIATLHHGQQSRQLMARHLYCMAMLLMPTELQLANRPAPLTGAARARALAQWAANVVDFRDADLASTRFAYDPEPFVEEGGTYWLPNRDGPGGSPVGEVVWGVEQPELLLTETGAFHDLRVRDTNVDTTMKATDDMTNPDDDYDQYRIPQGSLFLELFCPRTTASAADRNVPGVGGSIYSASGSGEVRLNVSALSPPNAAGNRFPVFRIALSDPHPPGAGTASPNSHFNDANTRHSTTYQLAVDTASANLSGLRYNTETAMSSPQIDRIIWFGDAAAAGLNISAAAVGLPAGLSADERRARVYFGQTPNVRLDGGQYMVVGPRQTTYFGSKTSAGLSQVNEPNNHRIVLAAGDPIPSGSGDEPHLWWASVYTGDNELIERRGAMRDIVPVIARTPTPEPWRSDPDVPDTIGLNVSEPHPVLGTYYEMPTDRLNRGDTAGDPVNGALGFADLLYDAYYDYGAPNLGMEDKPFDSVAGTPIAQYYEPLHPMQGNSGVAAPGTQLDWCTAFLQRLADPERPWHAVFNPYLTVDWMPIDLTVISGEDQIFTDPMKMTPFEPTFNFAFRQKNGTMLSAPTSRGRSFLSYANDISPETTTKYVTGTHMEYQLPVDNVTGTIGTLGAEVRPTAASNNFVTLGYLNSSYSLLNDPTPTITPLPPEFQGSPAEAPASLVWFNRDFSSPYELMLVPFTSPGQVMQDFGAPAMALGGDDHYSDDKKPNAFPHLLNFFLLSPGTSTSGLKKSFAPASLFELVTTPSPWSDESKVIRPIDFNLTSTRAGVREQTALGPLLPPYNKVHRMVEPGRVNINTVEGISSSSPVWHGVEWNYLGNNDRRLTSGSSNSSWPAVKASRDGYTATPTNGEQLGASTHLNGAYPTQFPGVFKSSFAAGRVPPTRQPVLDAVARERPVMSTLLRQGPSSSRQLFEPRTPFKSTLNPLVEYLPSTRLANLVTNRSNVFAVWVTVGFFEYSPTTGIGPEYGWDTGTSKRHRGFYVIDRSIPVAFEPGAVHNTEKAILLKRFIE